MSTTFYVGIYEDDLRPLQAASAHDAAQFHANENSISPGECVLVGCTFTPYAYRVEADTILDDTDRQATDEEWPGRVIERTYGERRRGDLVRALSENEPVVSAFEALVNESLGLGSEGAISDIRVYEVDDSYSVRVREE